MLWHHYKRICKDNGAIVLFCIQPFTSILTMSNISSFRYQYSWKKSQGVNFAQCNHMPLKIIEEICVFGKFGMAKSAKIQPIYNPQGLIHINKIKPAKTNSEHRACNNNKEHIQKSKNYPTTLIEGFKQERGLHPTQKPVALLEYLIKTYTNEGDTVLDNCMGSGTTGVACQNLNRKFIGIELDDKYFQIAKDRIEAA